LRAAPRPGRDALALTLLVRNPGNPPEHGIDDPRRLGVHLRSLLVRVAAGTA